MSKRFIKIDVMTYKFIIDQSKQPQRVEWSAFTVDEVADIISLNVSSEWPARAVSPRD